MSLDNLSRSDLLRMKSDSYLEDRTNTLREITDILEYDSDGLERKTSFEVNEASDRDHFNMSVDKCTALFKKIKKGELNDQDEREGLQAAKDVNQHNSAATYDKRVEMDVNNPDIALTSAQGIVLTKAQRLCVGEMKKDMKKGQMLIFVQGAPGSGKTTTARQLGIELGVNVLFSGTTGTASAQHRSHTINSLLSLGLSIENFDERSERLSINAKIRIRKLFKDVQVLAIDEVSMLNPVMLALIDLRLRQCFDAEKIFGGIHIVLLGDMF